MKTLAFLQPWAWAITDAGKRIENRQRMDGRMPRECAHRGPLLIHASKGTGPRDYYDDSRQWILDNCRVSVPPSDASAIRRGGIVGYCNVVAAVTPDGAVQWSDDGLVGDGGSLDMRWHIPGSWGLVLEAARPLPFMPWKGALGLFDVPDSALSPEIVAALEAGQ